ncbi:HTH-type transcriptional regulator NimR [Vibrio stylophorae]|uniref:HTH-type transcriptional regulator NimR n=1 Tax=Vibrio stylophorae TaxID=659351 RepID=A0ABM8ZWT9_9VIBR|nr:helix-turn-helix transcriptional regulator [Vibrio stylophorae]CAH0535085.1 HTH-type transcriptional regulator NimR [Vibrio stylophorae]
MNYPKSREDAEIFFNYEIIKPNTYTQAHHHPWGQLQLIRGGVLELKSQGKRFLSPPQYAIWVPPNVPHESYIRRTIQYCSVNIALPLALQMPSDTCLLSLSAIAEAIIAHLRESQITHAQDPQTERLIAVLLDQLMEAESISQYLPMSDDKLLTPILRAIERDPTHPDSLATWAKRVHTTERTLARHFQQSLGLSFVQWRQRRKFLYALQLLRRGQSVKEIALTLGYHQSTPFIQMFKRLAGCTPEQYRQRLAGEPK